MNELIEVVLAEVRALRAEQKQLPRLAVNLKEAAAMLGRSPKTVAKMLQRGELMAVTLCGDRMIPMSELKRVTTPKQDRKTPARRAPVSGSDAKAGIAAMLKRTR